MNCTQPMGTICALTNVWLYIGISTGLQLARLQYFDIIVSEMKFISLF